MYYIYNCIWSISLQWLLHLPVAMNPRRDDSRRLAPTLRTTLGSFLCSALRDELEVDCVLFDGGNIRGADLAWDRPIAVCSTCANDVYNDIFIFISDHLIYTHKIEYQGVLKGLDAVFCISGRAVNRTSQVMFGWVPGTRIDKKSPIVRRCWKVIRTTSRTRSTIWGLVGPLRLRIWNRMQNSESLCHGVNSFRLFDFSTPSVIYSISIYQSMFRKHGEVRNRSIMNETLIHTEIWSIYGRCFDIQIYTVHIIWIYVAYFGIWHIWI